MNLDQTQDITAMIRGGAEIVTKLLEHSSPDTAESIHAALTNGAAIGIRLDVIPAPRLKVILTEPDGSERVLIDFVLEARSAAH